MRLGSLFDGSGGFPLAASMCGCIPKWASEVEPYPIAVTRSRFPSMKHLGSVTDIHGGDIEPVDIITFGSPCQDLSVAGKRAGLKHEANGDEETTRSGLFMEAVRIIKEMREATNGEYPRFALWENVPGAFSSNKGEDFRTVLEELIRIVEPNASMPPVPKAGWAYADSYRGDGWSLAYRVFDAQYWGVPQRRRRIHLVVDFRGQCAREVLFEREGVRGYFAEGRTPWKGIAAHPQGSVGADDREGTLFEPRSMKEENWAERNEKNALRAEASKSSHVVVQQEPIFNEAYQPVQGVLLDDQGGQQINVRTDDKSPTLRAETHGNLPCVVEKQPVYCLQGNGIDRADTAGCNDKGWKEDTSYTLNTIDRPAVAYLASGKETVGTLMANAGTKLWLGNQEAFSGDYHIVEEQYPKELHDFIADHNADVPHQQDQIQAADGVSRPLVASTHGAASHHTKTLVRYKSTYIVRRLTPTECARLQGFPDCWGDIDEKADFTDEEYSFWMDVRNTHAAINGKQVKEYTKAQMLTWYNKLHTDSAEYKMWGNGIALPCAADVLGRIAKELRRANND